MLPARFLFSATLFFLFCANAPAAETGHDARSPNPIAMQKTNIDSPFAKLIPDSVKKDTTARQAQNALPATAAPVSTPDCTPLTGEDTVAETGYLFNKTAHGYLFTRQQIARTDATTLAGLLSFLPGMSVRRNTFWLGAEEIRINGQRAEGAVVTVDGVPYAAKDYAWQALPPWSPASFKSIRVSEQAGIYGGKFLLVELESYCAKNEPPLADVLWETGPFGLNLLDVLFSRHVGKTVSVYAHSRSAGVVSKQYEHPDIITTFYESMGKDSAHMVQTGFNPMQEFRELRIGVEKSLPRGGSIYMNYANTSLAESLFLNTPDSLSTVTPGINRSWMQRNTKLGHMAVGAKRIHSPWGTLSATLYRKEGEETGIRVWDSFSLAGTDIEAGAAKIFENSDAPFRSPVCAWLCFRNVVGPAQFETYANASLPADTAVPAFEAGENASLAYRALFLSARASYGVFLPLHNATYTGIPVIACNGAPDTAFRYALSGGATFKGCRLWLNYAAVLRNGSFEPAGDSALFSDSLDYADPEPDRSVSFGAYTEAFQRIQFGTASTFAGNGSPSFQQHMWVFARNTASRGKLHYDATLCADYVSSLAVRDIAGNTRNELAPFWDVSLKLGIQIKQFRLFYLVQNLLDSRRQYYAQYRLPGVTFLWGIHWMLRS